jgi:hypothetical protein
MPCGREVLSDGPIIKYPVTPLGRVDLGLSISDFRSGKLEARTATRAQPALGLLWSSTAFRAGLAQFPWEKPPVIIPTHPVPESGAIIARPPRRTSGGIFFPMTNSQ